MTDDLGKAVTMAVASLRRMRAPESMVTLALAQRNLRPPPGEEVATLPRPAPMFKDDAAARAVLRIEIDRGAEYALAESAYRNHDSSYMARWADYRSGKLDGPLTFMGVAVYFVERLPAPGWRVVNPMS